MGVGNHGIKLRDGVLLFVAPLRNDNGDSDGDDRLTVKVASTLLHHIFIPKR